MQRPVKPRIVAIDPGYDGLLRKVEDVDGRP
jgi:hypothetical protein